MNVLFYFIFIASPKKMKMDKEIRFEVKLESDIQLETSSDLFQRQYLATDQQLG